MGSRLPQPLVHDKFAVMEGNHFRLFGRETVASRHLVAEEGDQFTQLLIHFLFHIHRLGDEGFFSLAFFKASQTTMTPVSW